MTKQIDDKVIKVSWNILTYSYFPIHIILDIGLNIYFYFKIERYNYKKRFDNSYIEYLEELKQKDLSTNQSEWEMIK